ncbi:MAG: type II secretion system protein, partial [Candidatus Binatia bacterium]|nr:type II secretion system protein [Candidatus Binatia bacterium]
LIELLVVIAIIGILAALVLVALGNAREKANDARIKSDVGQLRTIAEIIYDSQGAAYQNTAGTTGVAACFNAGAAADSTDCGDQSTADSVAALATDVGEAYTGSALTAVSSASAFCVQATLNQGEDDSKVCVDASGAFQEGAWSCNATAFTCTADTP